MNVLAADPVQKPQCVGRVDYVPLTDALARSDIVTLHCPLNDGTLHLINSETLAKMKRGAILVNTSRGAVVDTRAVIDALKRDQLGGRHRGGITPPETCRP
jgi:D-lactate dehydrogenase